MNPQQVAQIIEGGLAGAKALVKSEDNVHFEAVVIAPAFAGKRFGFSGKQRPFRCSRKNALQDSRLHSVGDDRLAAGIDGNLRRPKLRCHTPATTRGFASGERFDFRSDLLNL